MGSDCTVCQNNCSNCRVLFQGKPPNGIDPSKIDYNNIVVIDPKEIVKTQERCCPSKFVNSDLTRNSITTIQARFRGAKKRKDFKEEVELLRNIANLECTQYSRNDLEEVLNNNKGEELSKNLEKEGLIKTHTFQKKTPSKYIMDVPLTYIDKNKSDDLYEGQMTLNKVKSGYGIFYSNNSKYEGFWENDKLNGYSRMFLGNGDYFEGYMKNGIAQGQGKFIHSDGSTYEGNWLFDKPHGKGVETYNDGSIFEGEFSNGAKVKGKLLWNDGSYYDGQIKKNLFEGEGFFHWAEGREYNGTWKEGKMDGHGEMTYTNGSIYTGEFKQGKRNGQGKYSWNDNKSYEGEWLNGKQNGFGIFTKDGKVIKGNWKDGVLTIDKENKSIDTHGSFKIKKSININSERYTTNSEIFIPCIPEQVEPNESNDYENQNNMDNNENNAN